MAFDGSIVLGLAVRYHLGAFLVVEMAGATDWLGLAYKIPSVMGDSS